MLAEPPFEELIAEIVARDPNQMSSAEYHYVSGLLRARGGCNLLVFGVGNDSGLWLLANRRGHTLFLEDSLPWLRKIQARLPEMEAYPVHYGTRRGQWREMLEGDPAELALELPLAAAVASWDLILVDGPAGYADSCPGRMKSLYTAAALARRRSGIDVVVHDCDRPLERAYCERFFGDLDLVRELDRLRHYHNLASPLTPSVAGP